MTNLAAIPIYVKKTYKVFFSGTQRPLTLKVRLLNRVLDYYHVCSNDHRGRTLTYFMLRLGLQCFCMGES